MTIKGILTSIIFFLLIIEARSQYGFELWMDKHHLAADEFNTTSLSFPEKYTLIRPGAFLWKRLKNYRLEFLPGISLGLTQYNVQNPNNSVIKVTESAFQAQIPILAYPFSFENDCNCPTFKKTGNVFTKGFHFFVSPAFRFLNRKPSIGTKATSIKFPLSFGAGMDFGISKSVTITPSFSYTLLGLDKVKNFAADKDNKFNANHSELNFGIRLHYRLDYRRY